MNFRPPSRTSKDYVLPFLIIVSLGVVAALTLRLWGLMGEDETSLSISGKAELGGIAGEVAVYLPAAEAWKIVDAAVTVNAGEGVRTATDGSATLTFDDGSVLTLVGSSELAIEDLQNSLTKKTVSLTLARGSAWTVVGTADPDFSIQTTFLRVRDADGTFLLAAGEDENTASVVAGGLTATVLDPQNPKKSELKNFVVEAGETLEISERRVNLLRIGGEIELVKETPATITNSNFYLAMTGGTATVAESETEAVAEGAAAQTVLPAPLVITGNGNITAASDPVKVSGKVAPEIVKVEVAYEDNESFALSKFEAGSGEWSYNAALDFGNLKVGLNNYTIVGSDAEGNKTPPANFQITFGRPADEETESGTSDEPETASNEEPRTSNQEPAPTSQTDGVPAVGSETFGAPVVNEPADGATIAEAPIRFTGSVPAGTKEVFVNEYKLGSFTAGDTSWKYNADLQYENLTVGENEYEIVAVSETGDRSAVTIKITYQPETEE